MVYLFLANGFEEIEALCPLDLLRRVGVEVTVVGVGSDKIMGAHGITVSADVPEEFYRDSNPEMIILPGGMPGTKNLDASKTVHSAIRAASAHGSHIAAICAAPMILGKLGLLRDKEATCFPGFEEYLDGATISEMKVVTDGNITTAKGMGCALDFGLELVALLRGKDVSEKLRRDVQA